MEYGMKNIFWYKTVYIALRLPFFIYYKIFHNYHYKKYKPKNRPFMVLSNHNSEGDQFMVGLAIKGHMFFVASEHIIRNGIGGKLIKFLANPIIRKKGAQAKDTIKDITDTLNNGSNVCMFVEGNRSFNGQTGWISPTNGTLVKNSKAALITFRLEGGYFRTPRWAAYKRKGPEFGHVVNEYSIEQLQSMTEDQITQAIRKDLYSNAFDSQKQNPHKYKGKNLAEHLETVLFVCPKCKDIDTLKSDKNLFYCSCGYKVYINEYCAFEDTFGNSPIFENVYDWDMWQRTYLKENISMLRQKYKDQPIFSHEEQTLSIINAMKNAEEINTGTMQLFCDRLVISSKSMENQFLLSDITGFSISLRMTIFFSTADNKYYEIKSGTLRTGVGYLMLYRFLTGRDYI